MTGPFSSTPPQTRRRVIWISAIAYVAIWAFLIYQDSKVTKGPGPGIVPFEVAGSSGRATEILGQWGSSGKDAARVSLIVDYAFIVAYGVLLAMACTALAERLRRRGWPGLSDAGGLFAWFGLGAAACDAVENACLLIVLGGNVDIWPRLAQIAAIAKFTLTTLAILYILAGLLLPRRRAEAPA